MVSLALDNAEKQAEGRVLNLDEKIYFLCFKEPKSRQEVADILYGKDTRKSKTAYSQFSGKDGKFKELVKKKWIKPDKRFKPDIKNFKKVDGRFLTRDYFRSDPFPIILKIKEGAVLDSFDEYVLREKLMSPFFKSFIGPDIPSNPIEYIITTLDFLFLEIDKNIGLT